jgi:hypothetical protein
MARPRMQLQSCKQLLKQIAGNLFSRLGSCLCRSPSASHLIRRLSNVIEEAHPDLTGPFYEVLASACTRMDEQQKLVHGLTRAYTMNAMRPLNVAMIDWLASDTHFKGRAATGPADNLASNLQTPEARLLLWRAKCEFWIPDKPERAIVYMLNENEYGVGFPTGIER